MWSCLAIYPSVCPHWTTRLPLVGFSWKLILRYFSKICQEKSSFIKIWQEKRVLYMKADIWFRSYLAQFVIQWKMFHTNVEKIKTHTVFSTFFFSKIVQFTRYGKILPSRAGHRWLWLACIACWIPNVTNTPRICNMNCFSAATMVV